MEANQANRLRERGVGDSLSHKRKRKTIKKEKKKNEKKANRPAGTNRENRKPKQQNVVPLPSLLFVSKGK